MKSQPAMSGAGSRLLLNSPTSGDVDLERVEASQVLPYLYLGNERDAADRTRLANLNIKYILNVTSHAPNLFDNEPGIEYRRIQANDSAQQDLMKSFQEAFHFIGEFVIIFFK